MGASCCKRREPRDGGFKERGGSDGPQGPAQPLTPAYLNGEPVVLSPSGHLRQLRRTYSEEFRSADVQD